MNYRRLGKTGLMVSEIGFGAEWMERHTEEECAEVAKECEKYGINLFDCWMSNPAVRSSLGNAIKGRRDKWYIQGHVGPVWENGQHTVTRDLEKCKRSFEDLLTRLGTDYVDLGMIHLVDNEEEWEYILTSPYLAYVKELLACGKIRHIGLSTHNPVIAKKAALSGFVEMILFTVNPAFDILPATEDVGSVLPASEDINTLFVGKSDETLGGINPERAELYRICEQNDVGITVMKGFAGGRLFDAARSPFGVALTPVQCLHYCLTRPAVASVLAGYDTPEHVRESVNYETASEEEKDYASVLANAPRHAYRGQCTYCGHCKPCPMDIDIAMVNKLYDLAVMQPEIPASLRKHYESLEHTASECIGCRDCESRCPFGVNIAERMEKAAALFGK